MCNLNFVFVLLLVLMFVSAFLYLYLNVIFFMPLFMRLLLEYRLTWRCVRCVINPLATTVRLFVCPCVFSLDPELLLYLRGTVRVSSATGAELEGVIRRGMTHWRAASAP